MNPICITGWGAVSPAGWGADCLAHACDMGLPLPSSPAERTGIAAGPFVRRVPPPPSRPPQFSHPRLRRTSPISYWTIAAASEALAMDPSPGSLGIVFCTTCGGVQYSRRFYEEVLTNPAFASPMLFPETVLNAPASHLATVLASTCINYTLNGDATVVLEGLLTAAAWLEDARVERCLVIAAEESDWLTADVLQNFSRNRILAEGAGALLLRPTSSAPRIASLQSITPPFPLQGGRGLNTAISSAAETLAARTDLATELLCLGGGERPQTQRLIETAFAAWPKPWLHTRPVLGEGLAAGAAWQIIAGLHVARRRGLRSCAVPVLGNYQELTAARFQLTIPNPPSP